MRRSATVIGSGPNGLAAAIVLAQAGLQVEVREAAPELGGATRSGALTLPGFTHDLGSAVHPMSVSSPFFRRLRLENFGLKWIQPDAPLAHPFDDGSAVTLERNTSETAKQLGADERAYEKLYQPLVAHWDTIVDEVFRPVRLPHHPFTMAQFGLRALQPCTFFVRSIFREEKARALFAGSAAHSALVLNAPVSAAFGMILGGAAHAVGWPIAQGGAQQIANALARVLSDLGGTVITNARVGHLSELRTDLVLCDVTPRQFLKLSEGQLRKPFRTLLEQYRYGPGSFKVDWALSEPIPWRANECLRAGTVHLGATLDEIKDSEEEVHQGRVPAKPFVLLSQPTLFDKTRAPEGKHVAWAYCHVPNGWKGSALGAIEEQIERFAPGFRECILARAAHSTADMESWDENLVGGDVNGGSLDARQFVMRPTWRQYGTPLKGVFLCSAATPPGGSVHGLCGYWGARRALRWLERG